MNHVAPPSSAIDDDSLRASAERSRTQPRRSTARQPSQPPTSAFCGTRILALTVPRQYGGRGGGLRDTARVLGIVAEGCASTSLILAMQFFKLAGMNRGNLWPEAVRARIATEAVEHGALINALRVEPELGSPTRGGMPATVLRQTPQGWTLSGHKIFSTGAPGLRWMDVWARMRAGSATFWSAPTPPASASSRPGTISACGPPAATTCCSPTSRSTPPTSP